MRIARDFGTVAELYPPGVEHISDFPFRWFDAIRMALVFLSFEELPKDEKPPRRIWLQDDKLKAWFAEVERAREAKYGGKGKGSGDTLMEGESVENKAARSLIAGD